MQIFLLINEFLDEKCCIQNTGYSLIWIYLWIRLESSKSILCMTWTRDFWEKFPLKMTTDRITENGRHLIYYISLFFEWLLSMVKNIHQILWILNTFKFFFSSIRRKSLNLNIEFGTSSYRLLCLAIKIHFIQRETLSLWNENLTLKSKSITFSVY
jgi:hypothetical protein